MSRLCATRVAFIRPVEEFAELVLDRCQDRFGAKETSMLADGIDLNSGEPKRFTRIDSALRLALLHLAAAQEGKRNDVPAFYASNVYWDPKVVRLKRQKDST